MRRKKSKSINAWQEVDRWAALMADAPQPRLPDDMTIDEIAARRHTEIAQAGKWAEKQVMLGLLEKHKIKDERTLKTKAAYHPVNGTNV